jgi:hypothetical protein
VNARMQKSHRCFDVVRWPIGGIELNINYLLFVL